MEQKTGVLVLDGIYKKGYGIIPKFVMHDFELSLESKAIYAYFCALAGSGSKTFPYRETILKNLQISKNTYYVHYKALVEQGYIEVKRPYDLTKANIYTIVANPKKLIEHNSEQKKDVSYLKYNGLKSKGFGNIPKLVMLDHRLSIKSKGLYAYFCSYCGNSESSFPLKEDIIYHLGISEPTYYKSLSQLKELDYLVAVQRKNKGKFSVNDYYINEHYLDKSSDDLNLPNPKIWDNKNRDTNIWDTKNCDTNLITVSSNNNSSNNSLSISKEQKDRLTEKINFNDNNLLQIALSEILNIKKPNRIFNKSFDWISGCLEKKGGELILIDEINSFIENFNKSCIGIKIDKPLAYFKVSLWNWFNEKPYIKEFEKPKNPEASYDIEELQNYINCGIFNFPSASSGVQKKSIEAPCGGN